MIVDDFGFYQVVIDVLNNSHCKFVVVIWIVILVVKLLCLS